MCLKNNEPAERWGIPIWRIGELGERLKCFWHRYRCNFETRTRDQSATGYEYVRGMLRMPGGRNFTTPGRVSGKGGQRMQHFMTNSPWSALGLMQDVRYDAGRDLGGSGMLILDESASEKSSDKSVGAGRQYNGRLGKLEMSQVGTFLAYTVDGKWSWVDGELFLPEAWFGAKYAARRKKPGVPKERTFETKVELGWRMIERVKAEGFAFAGVGCDTLYGRSGWFRRKMAENGIVYMADVPVDTLVYLSEPTVAKVGRVSVRDVAPTWTPLRGRATARGFLDAERYATRVWTTDGKQAPLAEWLVIRRDADGRRHFALSNAPETTPPERLAWMKTQRHFIECANRTAKSELGWDELQAQKFTAWEHHLALTILAMWFLTQTKLDWAKQCPPDPALAEQLGVDQVPGLSLGNIRELMRAAMPLPVLSQDDAVGLVIEHLGNRASVRKSHLKYQNLNDFSP
jgi:SRSO17 transposase